MSILHNTYHKQRYASLLGHTDTPSISPALTTKKSPHAGIRTQAAI